MRYTLSSICAAFVFFTNPSAASDASTVPINAVRLAGDTREVTREFLLDRLHGGWAGMLIGGLEGLPHEFKYNEQPRETLPDFHFLEQGARSDDDNDFEWTHLWFMDQEGMLKLPYPRIVEIWKANMNQGIWVANKRARELMDQGFLPPKTGSTTVNQHAGYNLSGQFCVESYGMIAPGMPQAAADLGLHYARIAVSDEPLQAAQYWTSLISLMAFHQGPLGTALDAALAAVDPASAMAEVVADARRLHGEHPRNWKAARQIIHEKWVKQNRWNINSTPSNGALVLLALLYGEGDFYQTLQYAMAMGYDADCNAATAGAVLGAHLGFRHLASLPQFKMPDRYVNKTRPSLPAECKVSEQAETLMRICERVILANGGQRIDINGQAGYRVRLQTPRLLEPLQKSAKPRLLILTDIGGDPDDQQSMVRLLLYANEFDIEGLVATASGTPGELKEKATKPQLIRELVTAYGKVRDNLAKHADGFPSAAGLLKVIKSGNPNRGRSAIGDGHDTEASRWLIQCADRPDPRPLNIAIWGGQTDLAQALWRVRADRGARSLQEFQSRLRVFDIDDQDRIQEWMFEQFPDVFYILSKAPKGADKRLGAYRGMYLGGDESLTSQAFIDEHVRHGHGPLGALYPPKTWTAPNPHSTLKEGDTPSWFFFLENGLGTAAHPEWGGWGGRYAPESRGLFRDAADTVDNVKDARAAVWRWREAFQNDFLARLDWCVTEDYANANHHPAAVLNDVRGKGVVELSAKAGASVSLSAAGTSDPEGDTLQMTWFAYPEAGTFPSQVSLNATSGETTSLLAPPVTSPQTIHVILQVRDDGTPNLFAFRRAVITIQP